MHQRVRPMAAWAALGLLFVGGIGAIYITTVHRVASVEGHSPTGPDTTPDSSQSPPASAGSLTSPPTQSRTKTSRTTGSPSTSASTRSASSDPVTSHSSSTSHSSPTHRHRSIRLAGPTLGSGYPEEEFGPIVMTGDKTLDSNNHCGFIANPSGNAVTLTITGVRLTDGHAALIDTCADHDSYFDQPRGTDEEPTPFPPGTRVSSCSGAQLQPGWGCWLGIKGVDPVPPASDPSARGTLTFTIAYTCESPEPPVCAQVAADQPSHAHPVDVTAEISYGFEIQSPA
jgi:hypothetical protein